MSVLFGHPTGNPNSHQAALAHFEAGRLEAFCVSWMPTMQQLSILRQLPISRNWAGRLEGRAFLPLLKARRCEGRAQEWMRLLKRAVLPSYFSAEALAWEANDWLMNRMAEELRRRRPNVSAVHSYEDCSLSQFQEAKRSGRVCIYDMPIGYYVAWQELQLQLAKRFPDWLPSGSLQSSGYARPQQKREEMELADLVLVPSSFVAKTIQGFTDKTCSLAAYGVDCDFWHPTINSKPAQPFRFIYAGHCSIRKGTPLLLEAWHKAGLDDAELYLVGAWHLAESKKRELPKNVRFIGQVSRETLRSHMQAADVFVFPSFFEGFGLVVLEALACGLPFISSDSTVAADIADDSVGRVIHTGDLDMLIEGLRFFSSHKDAIPQIRTLTRAKAESFTWKKYREAVSRACNDFV